VCAKLFLRQNKEEVGSITKASSGNSIVTVLTSNKAESKTDNGGDKSSGCRTGGLTSNSYCLLRRTKKKLERT
jgi:hypothetical protein